MNYFELLGLAPAFDLDMSQIESAYFKAQRQYHPDRFVCKPPEERQRALQQSVDINNAYKSLKNPLTRAQYLLHLQGIRVGTEQDSIKPSMALLSEIMDWREHAEQTPEPVLQEVTAQHIQSLTAISHAYGQSQWDTMAQEVLRLGYIIKTQEELTPRQRHGKKSAP